MELINKVKTVLIGSLAVGSGGALYGYCSAPNTIGNKEISEEIKINSETKSSGSPYRDCVESSPTIPENKRTNVCRWLYRR